MKCMFKVFSLKKIIRLVVAVAIPLLVGITASLLSGSFRQVYMALVKPPLAPPPVVFPIVWTLLYILMGIASFIIYERGLVKDYVQEALKFYGIQLILNFLWPIIFFRFQMLFAALWLLLLLWIIVGITTAKFYRISHAAGIIMLPYWLWLSFAVYLNLGIWLLNR